MVSLIWFVLCVYGMTQILVYGKIFKNLRPSKKSLSGFGEVFHCPMCMGFWIGVFFFGINRWTELFTYEYTLANLLILGCAGSGSSYILCTLFGDEGIKHEHTNKT